MGVFSAYVFVAGLVLLASYIIYKWLLSTENQPAFNRFVLLAIYILAFAAWPAVGIANGDSSGLQGTVAIGPATAGILDATRDSGVSVVAVLLWIYVAGMFVIAVWTLIVAIKLARIVASGEKIQVAGATLVFIDRNGIAPFSWGRYVVMGRNANEDETAMILCHERAHIRCMHYADLLLAQAVCIVLWYNPASWLMLSELKSVHEYQADSHVLSSGINARQYQLLLIKKAVGVRFPSLANSLNHSNLKKRITMMYNRKTSAVRRSRALAIVPAVALALALVNVPSVSRAIDSVTSAELSLGAYAPENIGKVTENPAATQEKHAAVEEAPDVLPKYTGGEMAMFGFLTKNVKYPEAAVKDSVQGRVVVKFTVQADGAVKDANVVESVCPAIDEEAIRVVMLMPKWVPGEKDGKKVACSFTLPISFKLQ